MFFYLEARSWGRLKDPGLSEAEIRQGWRDFQKIMDSAGVKGNYPFMACFEKAARKYGISLPLLLAIARGESNFDPEAKSIKDCYGVMQIQWPDTGNDLGIYLKSQLLLPCVNIDAGAKYLSWLLKRYNDDTFLAVAAYNYGPNAVSAGHVPEGARWYAAYIHRHLRFVITKRYEKTGRLLLIEFTFYRNAADFAAYLKGQVKGLPIEVFKSRKYTYDIWLTVRSFPERDKYLKLLWKKAGLKPIKR